VAATDLGDAELLERRSDDAERRRQPHDRQHVVAPIELGERLQAVLERGTRRSARPAPEIGHQSHAEHAAEHLVGVFELGFKRLLPVDVLGAVRVVGPHANSHVADLAVPLVRALERAGERARRRCPAATGERTCPPRSASRG
jgi:hypothetical protein